MNPNAARLLNRNPDKTRSIMPGKLIEREIGTCTRFGSAQMVA